MKAVNLTGNAFRVLLFVFTLKRCLNFRVNGPTKPHGLRIQMKSIEQYFAVVLFVLLYSVVLTFESVDETPGSEHLNGIY